MTPQSRIKVIGSRQTKTLAATVDTGFDGDLCVPISLAVQLGLDLTGDQIVEYADGSQKRTLVFAGSVRFFGETRAVEIILTESEEGLIGTRLLDHFPVSIEFPGGQVKLRPRPKTGGKRKSS